MQTGAYTENSNFTFWNFLDVEPADTEDQLCILSLYVKLPIVKEHSVTSLIWKVCQKIKL